MNLDDDPVYQRWAEAQIADYIERAWSPPTPDDLEAVRSRLGYQWADLQERIADQRKRSLAAFHNATPSRAASVAESAEATGAIAEVDAWRERTAKLGAILVLSGSPGTGKTVCAARVSYTHMLATGHPYKFVRAADLVAMSRYDDERDKYSKADALIVDDLGAEYLDGKGSALADLDALIDEFYSSTKRHLAITTNCTKAEFKARYGGRIEDRIREVGTWITLTGESRRKAP